TPILLLEENHEVDGGDVCDVLASKKTSIDTINQDTQQDDASEAHKVRRFIYQSKTTLTPSAGLVEDGHELCPKCLSIGHLKEALTDPCMNCSILPLLVAEDRLH
ncbi:hypothetical protein CHARACLAT_030112, partial [Characodon lateralis]|nr:hypothetical protein [Characodon lateralis]